MNTPVTSRFIVCFLSLLFLTIPSKGQQSICGCTDIQNTYSNAPGLLYGSHSYDVGKLVICNRRQEGCTREFVYETLLSNASFAAPDAAAIPVEDCHNYKVSFAMGMGGGHITIKLDQPRFQLTNYTRKDHTLHPGKVVRQVIEQPNGDIVVRSVGSGSGLLPKFNESKAPGVWSEVEELLRQEVQRNLPPVETMPFSASAVGRQRSGKRAEAGDLIIVEVSSKANLGFFTTNVPASGIPLGRQHYNKPEFADLPHGVLILHQGGTYYTCRPNPFTQTVSTGNRIMLSNVPQADGLLFMARQSGDISFELNDNDPQNNWGNHNIAITIVPYSQHRGRDIQTALNNYLSTFRN